MDSDSANSISFYRIWDVIDLSQTFPHHILKPIGVQRVCSFIQTLDSYVWYAHWLRWKHQTLGDAIAITVLRQSTKAEAFMRQVRKRSMNQAPLDL